MVDELIVGAVASSVVGTALVNRVSEAVGGFVRPWQIQRVAEAEAKAEAKKALILAESEIEVTDVQRRAAFRWLDEETKYQINIESITHQALPHLNDDAEPEKIEDDFLRNFFDKCRIVSDEQMQGVWARILAGEANNPGTFSRKTINILADMDKGDADRFTTLCCFVWTVDGDPEPLVLSGEPIFSNQGVTLPSLTDLESLGLVRRSPLGYVTHNMPERFRASYFTQTVELTLSDETENRFGTGTLMLTTAGLELIEICDGKPIDGFFEFMCDQWNEDSNIESVKVVNRQHD